MMFGLCMLWSCVRAPASPPVEVVDPASEPVELLRPLEIAKRLSAPGPGRVVNFWATWCGPCREEQPRLRAFALKHPNLEMVWVSLDLASLHDSKVVPYIHDGGWNEGIVHWQLDDPDPAMALRKVLPTWPDMVPVTLVVDAQGQVIQTHSGAVGDEELTAIAEVLLK